MEESSEVKPVEDSPKTENKEENKVEKEENKVEKKEEANPVDLGIIVKIAEPPAERVVDTGIAIPGGLGLIPVSGHPLNNMYYIVDRENPTGTMNNHDMNLVRSNPAINTHDHSHNHDHYDDSDSPPSMEDTDNTDDNDEYITAPFIPGPNPNFGNPLLRQPTFHQAVHQPSFHQPPLHQPTQITTNPLSQATLQSLMHPPNPQSFNPLQRNNEQNLTNLHSIITGSNPPDPNNPQVRVNVHPLNALREALEAAQRGQQERSQVESSGRRENIDEPNANRRPPTLNPILQPRQNTVVADSLNELGRLFSNNNQSNDNQEELEPENSFQRLAREIAPQISEIINQNGGLQNLSGAILNAVRAISNPSQQNIQLENTPQQNTPPPQGLPRPVIQPIRQNPVPRTPTPDDFLPIRRRRNVRRRLFQDEGNNPSNGQETPIPIGNAIPEERAVQGGNRPIRMIPEWDVQRRINEEVVAAENRILIEVERRNIGRERFEGTRIENRFPFNPRAVLAHDWNIEKNTIRNINLMMTLISILQAISLLFIGAVAVKSSDYFWLSVMFMAIFVTGYVVIGHFKGRKIELANIIRNQKESARILPINGRNAARVIDNQRVATARRNNNGDLSEEDNDEDNSF